MAEKSLAEIIQELTQLQRESAAQEQPDTAPPANLRSEARQNPLFDVGFFLLIYMFWLVVLSNVLLACGVTISGYNCLLAVPASWLTLWLANGKKPLYALLIALIGTAVVLLSAYAAQFVYDIGWDSNYYHKVDAGLLAKGWNPFTQSMGDYAYGSGIITNFTDWPVWYDGYPKATYTIGACFYALLGSIEAGKCFNVLSMVMLVCMGTPLLQKAVKLKRYQALIVSALVAVNPISVSQALTYYNDGFTAALLAAYALALIVIALDERGGLWRKSWFVVLFSLSIGLNTKFSGLIYFLMLGFLFYLYMIVRAHQALPFRQAARKNLALTAFIAGAAACAVVIAGATTYPVNLLRYQNPLYSVVGLDATPLADQEMPVFMRGYPKIVQFLLSIFSSATNLIADATEMRLKIPFTIGAGEWESLQKPDIRVSGWGIVFGGVFLVSVLVILIALAVMAVRLVKKKKQPLFVILLMLLVYLFVPPFFVKGLWWAKYYVHLFWVPAAALCALFVFRNGAAAAGKRFRSAASMAAALAAACLLTFNVGPSVAYCKTALDWTQVISAEFDRAKKLDALYDHQLYVSYDMFYGAEFNLLDAGIDHSFAADPNAPGVYPKGLYYAYVSYLSVPDTENLPADTEAFLAYLREIEAEQCIFIAASDEASAALDEPTVQAMRGLGLDFDMRDQYRCGYLAVIRNGDVLYERVSPDKLEYGCALDGHTVSLTSAGYDCGPEAKIAIDGIDVSLHRRGLNVVVYDPAADKILDIAAIDTYSDRALSR